MALILAIIAFFAGRFVLDRQLTVIHDEMDTVAASIRVMISEHPAAHRVELERQIIAHTQNPDIVVRVYPATPPNNAAVFPWAALFGFHRIRLPYRDGFTDILVDPKRLDPIIRMLAEMTIAGSASIFIFSWLTARFLTRQAIEPLILVTDELRRFAKGDFTPRPVSKIDRDEFGQLTSAYNAAAAQVSAAFEEHVRVEEQMKRFVADASHELRTPLTVISGYLDILKKMDPTDTIGHERAFRTLDVETKRVRLLVDRLVALARLEQTERAQREVLNMRTVTNDVVLEVTAARGVAVELAAGEDFTILADLADVYDSIRNLIENAVKYGEKTPVRVELFCTSDYGCVRVCDGGPGIPVHERMHLFERFFRGERRANIEGSGLGLSIVARAMQRSHGMVTLESAERGDTRFLLRFPRHNAIL